MISNNIKIYREKLKITQEDLSSAVGVSRQTIIAIEKGNYEPSLGLAFKLAKFFSAKGQSRPKADQPPAGATNSGGKVAVEELFVIK